MEQASLIETGIYRIPLLLSPSLESERRELELALLNGQRRLRLFAQRHKWSNFVANCFMKRAEIYDLKATFDERLRSLCQLDPSVQIPVTYSAALEERIFVAVSPQLFCTIYPEGIEKKYYEKLITHEMAHRLHIRLLQGNEQNMGPIWFFEGFALFAASQFAEKIEKLEFSTLIKILNKKERESYLRYAHAFHFIVKKIPIQYLIQKAGDENFIQWLLTRLEKKERIDRSCQNSKKR